MNNQENKEFHRLALQLASLQTIKAPRELHRRIEYAVSSLEDKQPLLVWLPMPVLGRSFVIAVLLFLLIGGGVIAAAEKSMPGDILYPVKQIVTSVKMQWGGEHVPSSEQQLVSPTAHEESASPTPSSEVSLTPVPSTDNAPLFITPTPEQLPEIPVPTGNTGDGVEETNNQVIDKIVPIIVPSLSPTVDLQVDAEVPISVNDGVIADLDINAGPVNLKINLGL